MTVHMLPSVRAAAADLAPHFNGILVPLDDPRYEPVREIWNAGITKRPGLIARCMSVSDVVLVVAVAQDRGVEVSVRGGGHNIAGTALCEDGIMIDLSLMKEANVDPVARTVHARPGLTWGEFDRATQRFGLATPGGVVSTTGIAGLTLGGGFGWLTRRHGWTCDNLLSADVVTASGALVQASPAADADLYWAVRGGGGNFGIATSLTYRLHDVTEVYAGFLVYELRRAGEVLRYCRNLMADAPDGLCLVIGVGAPPPVATLPVELRDVRVLRVGLCHFGGLPAGESTADTIRRHHQPAFAQLGPMSYKRLQTMLDAGARYGLSHYSKSHFINGLSDEAIEVLVDQARAAVSPRSRVVLHTCGGGPAELAEEATAFGHRKAAFNLQIDATWEQVGEADANIAWAKRFWSAMRPFCSGGVYVNFLSGGEDADGIQAAYRTTYDRLRRLKTRYDPTNFFRNNQNIRPLPDEHDEPLPDEPLPDAREGDDATAAHRERVR